MAIDNEIFRQTAARLRTCWQALKACYRMLDAVTRHLLGAALKLGIVVYFLFCTVVLGLRYVVLPNIDNYKPDIERIATQSLGSKVAIGGITASWAGLRPRLSLDDVVIHDQSGNAALTLPNVSATLAWWTFAVGDLRLHRLEISRPQMDMRRDADGRLYVAGIFIDHGKEGGGGGADWILSQREIIIRDGTLRWNDQQRAAPELLLTDVDFVLRNRWRHHRLALKATPPAALAAPLDVRAAFDHPPFGSIGDAMRWKGEVYVDVRNTDLAAWNAYVDYPAQVQQGSGSVRAWIRFDHAQLADLTADVSLANVSAQLGSELPPMRLAEASGRISVSEDIGSLFGERTHAFGANGHAVALTGFSLRTEDGLFLPPTTIRERFVPARRGRPARTDIHAELLDLQTLASFAERLPLPAQQRQLLAELAPRGVLRDVSAQWQGRYPDIPAYSVRGEFAGLSLRPLSAADEQAVAARAIPGIDNLTGRIDATERGGTLSIDSEQLAVHVPGYLDDPVIPFERLALQASWAFQEKDQLLLDLQKMEFVHEGIAGSLAGRHLMPLHRKDGQSPGTIDISGKLAHLELPQVGRYLPVHTPDRLRSWLTGALTGGMVKDVRLRLKGDLAHFPFRARTGKGAGEFSVVGRLENASLNYAPGEFASNGNAPLWPVIDRINGTIAFNHARMEIAADSAATSGTALSRVKVVIPDLAAHDLMLDVDGSAAGPLQEFLRFTKESPVAGWIGHFTEETKATGNAKLGLSLQLPLHRLREARVRGTLQFAGNAVTLLNVMPPLTGTTGKLDFHESGFSIGGIKSNFLGGPVTISGGTQRDGTTLVKADGTLSAEGVRKVYETPAMHGPLERMNGSARYSTAVRVANGHPEILVESNLVGIGLDFPVPLRKAPNESLPLRFELTGLASADPRVIRDEMKLSLGQAVSARYERAKPADRDAEWRVVRGGIGVNVPAPLPDSGLMVNISLKALDVDAWRRALAPAAASGAGEEAGQAQASSLPIAQYIEPEMLAARATELTVMDRKLDNVVVGVSRQKSTWQANIDSEQVSGYLSWMEAPAGRGLGKVTARLASLIIPQSAASEVSELLEGKNTSTQMPAVDLVAENFELFGKKFGHLELIAQNTRGAAGREWRIDKLALANADGALAATGKWANQDGRTVSELDYELDIADAGRLLDRFGFANVLRGGKGRMEGALRWHGLPFSLDIPSLSGRLQLNLAAGQFLKVDPSAAKLLGVLSLQSLPRRLALDFRDVFSEGFAFDGVTATAHITNGVAKTDNFKMRGVAATVLMDGTADIAKEAQNLHVVVIPEINVGAASVVYGLAVNPVIGVGTFLAQLFLRDPLMRAFTFEYQVTGLWNDPVVTKLVRQPATPSKESAGYATPEG